MKKEEEKVEDISENWKRLTEAIPDIEALVPFDNSTPKTCTIPRT